MRNKNNGAGVRTIMTRLRTLQQRARTRRALHNLDRRMLADIGRSECERRQECGKWFWQE
jgi:uncharacterized protein YjiS (DUF1127 family)